MQCTIIRPEHHKRKITKIEDDRSTDCKIALARWILPFVAGQATYGNYPMGFPPKSISVRNYSNQQLYLATGQNDPTDITNYPDLVIPPRCVYNAPFGGRSYDREFNWSLPGTSYGNASSILAFIHECQEFFGDEIYNLPANLNPNAVESYEKGTVTDMSPGGTLAAGATDTYVLLHASVDLTVAADTEPMQFITGANAANVTAPFTLMPGEARSLGARYGYVSVTNEGGAPGGYRILNLYTSQTL